MITERVDPTEAAERAAVMRSDPKVRAWMRRARRLFDDMPEGAWIYWEGCHMNLMAKGPGGEFYVTERDGGSDQAAVVSSITVIQSDAGAW